MCTVPLGGFFCCCRCLLGCNLGPGIAASFIWIWSLLKTHLGVLTTYELGVSAFWRTSPGMDHFLVEGSCSHRLFLTTHAMLCTFRVYTYLLLGLFTMLDLQSVVVSLVVSCGFSGTCTGPGGFEYETLRMALLLSPDPVGLRGLLFFWMTGCGFYTIALGILGWRWRHRWW